MLANCRALANNIATSQERTTTRCIEDQGIGGRCYQVISGTFAHTRYYETLHMVKVSVNNRHILESYHGKNNFQVGFIPFDSLERLVYSIDYLSDIDTI